MPLRPRLPARRSPASVQAMTELYVGRLRALRAVDEMIDDIGEGRGRDGVGTGGHPNDDQQYTTPFGGDPANLTE